MDENKNPNENAGGTLEGTQEKSEKERRRGGETGEQFVKSIGVAGCVFFLAMFIIFLVFCFTSGSRPPITEAPQFVFKALEGVING